MVRAGIHPVLNRVTVIMRNGASFQMATTMERTTPYFLREDTTNHPAWTGEEGGISSEDEHLSKFMRKYEGLSAAGLPGRKEGVTVKVPDTADAVTDK